MSARPKSIMGYEKFAKQSFGSLYTRIKGARVLMVGAGGIGCELLKNLANAGFGEIHIVDLDTIDLSNLNRQFLFRHEHIKKSKALVAKETAGKFNPNVKIEAYHANIKDPQFNVAWFKTFTLVFNALDNLGARRHVNRMCLAANVPLIESGTTGFNGQVQPIVKGRTQCYDCNIKETPKTFPVCTIRSTPSQPIHCIVWAKSYLFNEIFGISEDIVADTSEDAENAKEIENLKQEAQALEKIRASMGSKDFPRMVFEKVYTQDIARLRSMKDMWKTRKPPEPLNFEELSHEALTVSPDIAQQDQSTWTLAENYAVFASSLERLSDRLKQEEATAEPILSFDKDDKDTLDFVAASANLRSIIFGIETKSEFEIKQIAGNIIPAIATTNAATASLCVLQALKVLKDELSKASMVFLERSVDRTANSETLQPPKPNCAVCSVVYSTLEVDTSRATLVDFVSSLREQLGYGEELSVSSDVGILYDPELDDNLDKRFSELGIKGDSFVTVVDDEDESPRVNVVFAISEQSLPAPAAPITAPPAFDIPRRPKPTQPVRPTTPEPIAATAAAAAATNGTAAHDHALTNGSGKRKRAADDAGSGEEEEARKKGRIGERAAMDAEVDGEVVLLDEAGGGAIVIDDD
ncbi:E1 ubiquitin-activating protein uba2 [Cryomyces antarcticus]|uniref:E1 ubiquitin-activating protein uba2 n=1 Tax=Cryomyces antarcticus TaxID=329879 RepID=A0ABR0KVJ0_9PEZI|nr:E1 ubiquitin-activating protein uba2 [Cryomyces antarcticus]